MIRLTVLSLALATVVSAQPTSISRAVPNAAATGDTIVLRGSFANGVNSVVFTAFVGGFLGTSVVSVTPTSVSSTDVVASVPRMAGFAPPNATPPGNPLGSVHVVDGNGRASAKSQFFFMQGTFIDTGSGFENPQTTTLGTGTTPSTGIGRTAVSFDLAGGPPATGNNGFEMELENAAPGSMAVLFVGFPSPPPFPPVLDGLVVLDLSLPFVQLPAVTTDANGDAAIPLPIPAGSFGVTLLNQWAVVDGGLPGMLAVSNGLQYRL